MFYVHYTKEDIAKMTPEEFTEAMADLEEEMNCDRMADEQDDAMYGNIDDDEYYMSDSHRADVEQEKWEWLKNE